MVSCPSAFPRSRFEDSGAGAWATFVAFEQITRLTSVKTGIPRSGRSVWMGTTDA